MTVGAAITNSGSGNNGAVKLVAGWDGVSTSAPVVTSGTGTLSFTSAGQVITNGGQIDLLAGQAISISGIQVPSVVLGSGGDDIKRHTVGNGGVNISAPGGTTKLDAGSGTIKGATGSGGRN